MSLHSNTKYYAFFCVLFLIITDTLSGFLSELRWYGHESPHRDITPLWLYWFGP